MIVNSDYIQFLIDTYYVVRFLPNKFKYRKPNFQTVTIWVDGFVIVIYIYRLVFLYRWLLSLFLQAVSKNLKTVKFAKK